MSSDFTKRVNELEVGILLLEKMQTYLRYGKVPTSELIALLAGNDRFSALSFLKECDRQMNQGTPFPQAWRSGLGSWKNTAMKPKNKEILAGVSDVLGSSDCESQMNTLGLTASLLKQSLREAVEEKNTIGKLYRSLGVWLGIGAAIFMA